MEVSLKQALIAAGVALALMLGLVAFWTIDKRAHEAQIVQLQNQLAARDQTIETQKGVYQKLALQDKDLSSLLTDQDVQLKLLKAQLDKQGADLLTANTLAVKLKKDLENSGHAVVVNPPDPQKPGELVVGFDVNLPTDNDPLFNVKGETVGDCGRVADPTVKLKLSQKKAVKFSVIVSQGKDGTWRSSATSSSEEFNVDIALAAVNPYMLEPKWYEKIGMGVDLGVGTNPGLLAGIGLYYQIGKFEVGPRAWVVVDRGVSPYFGAQLVWHPFQR